MHACNDAAACRQIVWYGHFNLYHKGLKLTFMTTFVCSIYERALAVVGTDYLSHAVWEKYLGFEEEQGNKAGMVALYTRAVAAPLRDLDKYYQG